MHKKCMEKQSTMLRIKKDILIVVSIKKENRTEIFHLVI